MGTHWRSRTNVRTDLGGGEIPFARAGAYSTRADSSNSKFDERERAAKVFACFCAVAPLAMFAIVVLLLSIYRLFQS